MKNFNNIKIREAKTFIERLIGLMFKKNIKDGLGCKNCKSIHTFFMKEEIDVVATDIDDNIVKVYKSVKKNRIIIAPRNTYNIYELPKGTIK